MKKSYLARTILHLMGLDHTKLTYFHQGLNESTRPTTSWHLLTSFASGSRIRRSWAA